MGYIGATRGSASPGSSVSVDRPAGARLGDLLLVVLSDDDNGFSDDGSWAQIDFALDPGPNSADIRLFTKDDDGSSGPFVFTAPSSSHVVAGCIAYRNARVLASHLQINPSSTIMANAGLTVPENHATLLWVGTLDSYAVPRPVTAPGGFAQPTPNPSWGAAIPAIFERQDVSAGATGPVNGSWSTLTSGAGTALIALGRRDGLTMWM